MTTASPSRPRAVVAAVVLALCVLVVSGCGGGSHDRTATSVSTTASTTGTGPGTSATTAAIPTPIVSGDFPVPGRSDGQEVAQVSLYALKRVGPFLDLYFTYQCADASQSCDISFGSTFARGPEGDGYSAHTAPDGIALIDPVNGKVYEPVRGPDHSVYGSTAAAPAGPGPQLSWVRFAAPPASVSNLDVSMGQGEYFPDVAVDSGTIPQAPASWTVNQDDISGRSPSDTSASGLTLPVSPLTFEVANPGATDSQNGAQTTVALSSDVLFAFAKATLSPRAHAILARVATEIRQRARGSVKVTGYTDSIGTAAVNIPLSVHRAQAVVRALKVLTPGVAYTAAGKGAADPVAPNTLGGHDYPPGRAQNRRVTVAFTATRAAKPSLPARAAGIGPRPQTGGVMTFGTGLITPPPDFIFRASDITLSREGSQLLLQMTLTCVKAQDGCSTEYGFGGQAGTLPPQQDHSQPYSTGAFFLEDARSDTYYLVARDAYGNPLSSSLDDMSVGQSQHVWAVFPAPPAATNQMTLLAPADRYTTQVRPHPTGAVLVPVSGAPPQPTTTTTTSSARQ